MSDPSPDFIDAIFAAFDPGGAGTTLLSRLTGWPISTIHSWKGKLGGIPEYRRAEIVRAGQEAEARMPEHYKEPVRFTDAMLDYLDPERRVLTAARVAEVEQVRADNLAKANGGKTPKGEGEAGAARAESNANQTMPGWSAKAYAFLLDYAGSHCRFLGEDVRLAAAAAGVPEPPAPGAWGNVFKRAAKAKVIRKDGFEPSKLASTHGKAAVVWVTA